MLDDPFPKLNAAASQGGTPEELFAAFQEELDAIQKQGEGELEALHKEHTKERLEELKKKMDEL